jgi:hypothetical protein
MLSLPSGIDNISGPIAMFYSHIGRTISHSSNGLKSKADSGSGNSLKYNADGVSRSCYVARNRCRY